MFLYISFYFPGGVSLNCGPGVGEMTVEHCSLSIVRLSRSVLGETCS